MDNMHVEAQAREGTDDTRTNRAQGLIGKQNGPPIGHPPDSVYKEFPKSSLNPLFSAASGDGGLRRDGEGMELDRAGWIRKCATTPLSLRTRSERGFSHYYCHELRKFLDSLLSRSR